VNAAARFRSSAGVCEQQAAVAGDVAERAAYLEMATMWRALAADADDYDRRTRRLEQRRRPAE
jgi:hypothetical protein